LPIWVLGFCFGGTLAYLLAARAEADSVVSFYGSGVPGALGEIDAIRAPVQFHFGGDDPYIPREDVAKVERAVASRDGMEIHVQEDGGHAFHNREAPMFYQPEPAERAWRLTVDFLARTLSSSRGLQGERGELLAGRDAELRISLVEVVLDRPGAEEELGGDLAAAGPGRGEPDDLQFLRGEAVQEVRGRGGGLPGFAGGPELGAGAVQPRGGVEALEDLRGRTERNARVGTAACPSQPFAVEQFRAGSLERSRRPFVQLDGACVRFFPVRQEGLAAQGDRQGPCLSSGFGPAAETVEGRAGEAGVAGAHGRLDQVGGGGHGAVPVGAVRQPFEAAQRVVVAAEAEVEEGGRGVDEPAVRRSFGDQLAQPLLVALDRRDEGQDGAEPS